MKFRTNNYPNPFHGMICTIETPEQNLYALARFGWIMYSYSIVVAPRYLTASRRIMVRLETERR